MDKKYQIFVSSTYKDLIEERQSILKIIIDLGHIPSGMEGFFSVDEDQFEYIKKIIDQCDYYILILAGKYGSTDASGLSYTEKEFDYAVARGVTVLAFPHGDLASLPIGKSEVAADTIARRDAFFAKAQSGRLASFWKSPDELTSKVVLSLSKQMQANPRVGWVRGDRIASEALLSQVNDLRAKIDLLSKENTALKSKSEVKIENLAPLDDNYTITFTYIGNRDEKAKSTYSMSWNDIFKIVGPGYFKPLDPNNTHKRLSSHIETDYSYASISQTALDQINIQLESHGLLRRFIGSSVNGSVLDLMELTDLGKRVLSEIISVRS